MAIAIETIEKAKRRIKRFINGKPTHRVRQLTEKKFLYNVRHGTRIIIFKRDSLNRLRFVM